MKSAKSLKARKVEPPVKVANIVRDKPFAQRLAQACDSSPKEPPSAYGRLTWLKNRLEDIGTKVSVETVRKWYSGEVKPRPEKLALLARILEVDEAWLSLGVDPNMTPRERRVRDATVDGAVNLVAGFIQMDGGYPAYPDREDGGPIDIHAIIKGAKYDFHVSLADGDGKFSVPSKRGGAIILGVVRRSGFHIDLYEIDEDAIDQGGQRHGGSVVVTADLKKLKRITSFANRL